MHVMKQVEMLYFMKWYVLLTMLWIQVEDLSTGYSQYITGDSTAQ